MTAVIRSTSPQRPDDVVGEWPDGGVEAIDGSVQRATAAAEGWARESAFLRSRALDAAAEQLAARAEEIAALVVREVGKPIAEARGEVARSVSILKFYAQAALDPEGDVLPALDPGTLLITRRRPRGVVGLITPWNFPLAIPTWKLAPALAWGNAVVLKPSPDATACAFALASVFDLPPGALQVVPGGPEAGARLPRHPGIGAVSFTGSAAVGRGVASAASETGIPGQAEMGGQNAAIVLADADLEATAATLASAAMGYAGQKCTATRRIIAVGPVDLLEDALVEEVRGLSVGDPADPATQVGPVITEVARDRVLGAVQRAREAGARILSGGDAPDGDGWYVRPTLVDRVGPGDELAQEEVFGPVCAILPARDVDDAVRLANGTKYGLAAAVYTAHLGVALDVASRLEAGLVRVNAPTTGVDFHAPFGGEKASGVGPREQGRAAREFYTATTTVTISPPAGRPG